MPTPSSSHAGDIIQSEVDAPSNARPLARTRPEMHNTCRPADAIDLPPDARAQ
jgi:hypothetical protein